MFLSTLRRLTVLNSLVFLLIFGAFNAILYGYISIRLFDKIDDTMWNQANSFRIVNGRPAPLGRTLFDPRIFLVIRTTDGRVIVPNPFRSDLAGDVAEIAADAEPGELKTREYEGHVYRILSVPYRQQENTFGSERDIAIQAIIAVSIVDSEVGLLNRVFWIIVFGGIFSTAGIILAGYFLAKRAMVPIQDAWERQQQFVSDASHELRSPITGIHSNAELMLRHPERTIEEESHRVNTILKESTRMTRLIASLLTLARSDAGKAELQLAPVNVSEIIPIVAEGFKAMEELSGVSLVLDVKPGLSLVADRERLHQLLVILLDNAFKYTAKGGQVRITGVQSGKNIVLRVEDTGIGISPEHLPRVFDRFFRGDKARSRDTGGTGLGLAIAKWIVEKHKGKIQVESEPGKGTKFTVMLPAGKHRVP
ncbi:MAG TPA: HAMP domain-containing sensor histidine kinase [Selenomonadales bacterium]|nr:HAMP domain-containing sensor histidine kinase [Selenomonadales bacterium]